MFEAARAVVVRGWRVLVASVAAGAVLFAGPGVAQAQLSWSGPFPIDTGKDLGAVACSEVPSAQTGSRPDRGFRDGQQSAGAVPVVPDCDTCPVQPARHSAEVAPEKSRGLLDRPA